MQAFDATNHYFEQAANCLDLSENVRTLMVTPMFILTVTGIITPTI